jgi:hypothetical protein
MRELPNMIVPFKGNLYRALMSEFAQFLPPS